MLDCNEPEILSVTTTVGSPGDARRLALQILGQRLAACVQIDQDVTSLYHWQGRLCDEPEVRLTIKTLPAQADALQQLFAEHHPYEVPQFLAAKLAASSGYVQWVRGELTPAAPAQTPAR
jgi:periplasmic divalent cation tolerance protein